MLHKGALCVLYFVAMQLVYYCLLGSIFESVNKNMAPSANTTKTNKKKLFLHMPQRLYEFVRYLFPSTVSSSIIQYTVTSHTIKTSNLQRTSFISSGKILKLWLLLSFVFLSAPSNDPVWDSRSGSA